MEFCEVNTTIILFACTVALSGSKLEVLPVSADV